VESADVSDPAVVIEIGPGAVRRVDAAGQPAPALAAAALDHIDDPVALIGSNPVAVETLWRELIGSLLDERPDAVALVHPSWWPASRIEVVASAARTLAHDVVTCSRAPVPAHGATVIVEIATQFVVITDGRSGHAVHAESRAGHPDRVVDTVARVIARLARDADATVLLDAPTGVGGATALAAMITDRLPGLRVVPVRPPVPASADHRDRHDATVRAPRHTRMLAAGAAAVAVAATVTVGMLGNDGGQPPRRPDGSEMATAYLVEGVVTLRVPAQWAVERITAGPGSARVRVVSPSDGEAALHVTQSRVKPETLTDTAATLRNAVAAQPSGVFVDFNGADFYAGRPVVTYREIRPGHDIRWTVLLDDSVRISIGCQSAPGREDSVRYACEQAVQSARTLR
jgi:type VII secretion-associated protein (TIGR03931 family)